MSELLPCPFCGCTAIYVTRTHYYDPEDTVSIFCNGCKAHVTLEQNEAEGINEKTEAEAIEAWNTRAERTCNPFKRASFGFRDGVEFGIWECSACGCEINPKHIPNYCPNCGAKVIQ